MMSANFLLSMAYCFAAASEYPDQGMGKKLTRLLNLIELELDGYGYFMSIRASLEPFVNDDCLRWIQYELSVMAITKPAVLDAEKAVH